MKNWAGTDEAVEEVVEADAGIADDENAIDEEIALEDTTVLLATLLPRILGLLEVDDEAGLVAEI